MEFGVAPWKLHDDLHEQQETYYHTVSEELLNGILYATNASTVWADLKERFDKVNQLWLYQLHREITTFAQCIDSVSQYNTKLKTLLN